MAAATKSSRLLHISMYLSLLLAAFAVHTPRSPPPVSDPDIVQYLPWVNHGKILRDLHLDLIMGTFYGTCNESPVAKWIVLHGKILREVKVLT